MNKHIVKRNGWEDTPVVWCGRSIPGNSEVLSVFQAVSGDEKAICKNCLNTVIRKLEAKL